MGAFNKTVTVIPLVLVGYEIVVANSALRASLAIYHLPSSTNGVRMILKRFSKPLFIKKFIYDVRR